MTSHDFADRNAPCGRGQKTPGEHGSNRGTRNDGALASINSLVTGKGGDDRFNLIRSRHGADRSHRIDASPSRAGVNWRLSRCGFLRLYRVRTIPTVLN
jgi:hypothetical protein